MYDFEVGNQRFAGYCLDGDDQPVTSKRAAKEAEGVEKRKASKAADSIRTSDPTFAEAVASLAPNWAGQSDAFNKDRYAKELLQFFGPSTPIRLIGDIRVQEYIRYARDHPLKVWSGGGSRDPDDPKNARYWRMANKPKGRSPATINQYLNLLRQIFAQALKFRDPITGEPLLRQVPHVKVLDVPKRKARPVPETILQDVLSTVPQHVVEAITLTLYFGFRRGEAFRLQIRHIDFDLGGVRFFAEEVKDDEDEFLPGAPEAMAYLRKLVEQAEQRDTRYLISWTRRRKEKSKSKLPIKWVPIKGSKSAWRTAMKRIETEYGARYRWHDIRAAFVTHVAITSGGVAAQALARHSDFSTTRRYIHVADEVKRAAANKAAVRPALTEPFSKSPKRESQTREISRSHKSRKSLKENGAPEEIRTPDPQIRSLVLYPAELRARFLRGGEPMHRGGLRQASAAGGRTGLLAAPGPPPQRVCIPERLSAISGAASSELHI